jgi:hypothetical protein
MYKTTLRKTDGTEYTVDTYNGLTEQTTTTQSTHAPKEIFYGGVPKTGSMKIDDPQREIVDKVIDGTFDLSDTTVKTYYNDKLQGVFKTSDSDYEENSGELSVSLVDNISNWDKIQFAGRDYSLRADDAIKPNLYEILSYVLITTLKWDKSNTVMQADVDAMCSRTISVNMGAVIKDMTVKQFLQRIIIPYDYLAADNLRSTVDKICTVAQLNYSETNESGGVYPKNIRFFNARPAKAKSEKIISLPPSSQNEFPARDVLLKNKYSNVLIGYKQVNILNETGVVFSYTLPSFYDNVVRTSEAADKRAEYTYPDPFASYTEQAYAWMFAIYVTFSFDIPIVRNSNLTKIQSIDYGLDANKNPNINISTTGYRINGYATAPGTVSFEDLDDKDITYSNWELTPFQSAGVEPKYDYTYDIPDIGGIELSPQTIKLATSSSNIGDETIVTWDKDYYHIKNLKICIGTTKKGVKRRKGMTGVWEGEYISETATQLDVVINGRKQTISFADVTTYGTDNSIAEITGSSLFQDKARLISEYQDTVSGTVPQVLKKEILNKVYGVYGEFLFEDYTFDAATGAYGYAGSGSGFTSLPSNTKLYGKTGLGLDEIVITSGDYNTGYQATITPHSASYKELGNLVTTVKNSILSDYANGVSTCTTEITLDQLKYTDGTIAKQASEGEIIHIGDVVRLDRNSFGDSIYNYADGNPYLWRVTGTTLIYDGYPHQKLELQEITSGNRGLKYMSWETIESIANSGQAQNVFSIGDEKEIELSTGEKLTAVIIGFNHDKISDTKKAGITFFIKTPLATNYKMNSNQGVSTYWGSCSLRTTLLNDIKNTLPGWDDEENVVSANNLIKRLKPVQKKIFDYNDSAQTLTDDLFLLSAYEIGNSLGNVVWAQEGTQYAYFADNDNSVRALKNTDGVSVDWWTCSLGKKSTTIYREQYIYRNKTGAIFSTSNQTYSKAVAFAFCIGEVDA